MILRRSNQSIQRCNWHGTRLQIFFFTDFRRDIVCVLHNVYKWRPSKRIYDQSKWLNKISINKANKMNKTRHLELYEVTNTQRISYYYQTRKLMNLFFENIDLLIYVRPASL